MAGLLFLSRLLHLKYLEEYTFLINCYDLNIWGSTLLEHIITAEIFEGILSLSKLLPLLYLEKYAFLDNNYGLNISNSTLTELIITTLY